MAIRAQKTNTSQDDVRTLLAGGVLAALIALFAPLVQVGFDKYLEDRPFIQATLGIYEDEQGRIYVGYDADAVTSLDATWIASVYGPRGQRLASRRGTGSYSDRIDDSKLWSWDAFFDQEDGTPAPPIPVHPFKVCVRYIAVMRDTQVTDDSGPFCSALFNPN